MGRVAADASVFNAIADPTRRGILRNLTRGERSVSELMRAFDLKQSAFSQHLAVLRRAGLVTMRKDGRRRLYSFRAEHLREVADWISEFGPHLAEPHASPPP